MACFGAPPHVVLIGQRPAPLGRGVQFQFENMRPIIAKTERACSLWKLKIDLAAFPNSGQA